MTIYVDKLKRDLKKTRHGTAQNFSCRLFTDPTDDITSLIQFAASIGVPETALHRTVMPHFDIGFVKRCDALSKSAVDVDGGRAEDIEGAWRKFWNAKAS